MQKIFAFTTALGLLYFCSHISCTSASKLKDNISYKYYKDFDLIHLEFIKPNSGKPPLPYIRVEMKDSALIQAAFYYDTEKAPMRIFKPLNMEGVRAYSSESFDGKFLSYDTLISSGDNLYEFRYRYFAKKVNYYSILAYTYYSVDSFDVIWNNFSDASYKPVATPKIYRDLKLIQNFQPTDTGSFHFFRSNIFLMEFYRTSRGERITDPRGIAIRRWDFRISSFWTLFKHPLWYVLPNVHGLGDKRD